MLKLYVVVRNDIDVPFQMCQVAHAVANFATEHRDEFARWNLGNNTICVLQTPNGNSLAQLMETARDGGFKYTPFYEPDWPSMGFNYEPDDIPRDGWLTAVAFAPNWTVQNVLLADLPLALNKKTVEAKVGLTSDKRLINTKHYEHIQQRSETLDKLETGTKSARRQKRKDYFTAIDKGDH